MADKKNVDSKTQDKTSEKTLKKVEQKNAKNLKTSFIISAVGAFFFIGAIVEIGKETPSATFSWITIVISLIAGIFSVPVFLKENKVKKENKGKNFLKSVVAVAILGALVLGSIIAMIADPIAVKARCSAFNDEKEMSLGELSLCKDRREELKQQKQNEENVKKEATQKAKDECSAKKYDWNSSEKRCNTEEEQKANDEEEKARSECSAKNYDWNSSEKRCNTDSEQQAKNAEREAEKKRQEEANKTTTYSGKDHDENDSAGRYTKIMNACLDRLDHHFPNTYPLDSDDGYPIYYSVTLKGDGTLVEGSMIGYHRTKNGQKVLEYKCSYENGSAKIKGLD